MNVVTDSALALVLVALSLTIGYFGGFHQGRKQAIKDKREWARNLYLYVRDSIYRFRILSIHIPEAKPADVLEELRSDVETFFNISGYKSANYIQRLETTQEFVERKRADYDTPIV